jgi:hypothetical protein
MKDLKLSGKNDYAKSVCHFLAEGLRTRRIGLKRAAEIAQKVVDHINLLDTEKDFLALIKELSKDFEELLKLEDRIYMYIKSDDRVKMELKVKEFAVNLMAHDTALAVQIMEEAVKADADIKVLSEKFPQFKQFIANKPWPSKT